MYTKYNRRFRPQQEPIAITLAYQDQPEKPKTPLWKMAGLAVTITGMLGVAISGAFESYFTEQINEITARPLVNIDATVKIVGRKPAPVTPAKLSEGSDKAAVTEIIALETVIFFSNPNKVRINSPSGWYYLLAGNVEQKDPSSFGEIHPGSFPDSGPDIFGFSKHL